MKKTVYSIFVLFLFASMYSCMRANSVYQVNDETMNTGKTVESTDAIVYKNNQYGFSFSLPESWKGYKILTDRWIGTASENIPNNKIIRNGPMLYIRHPKWTVKNPRQDIPIMIFTLAQWESLKREEFHIGAAPFGPSELGRNSKYVLALPARYNYAFPTGYREVENILNHNPLKMFDVNYQNIK